MGMFAKSEGSLKLTCYEIVGNSGRAGKQAQ